MSLFKKIIKNLSKPKIQVFGIFSSRLDGVVITRTSI